MQRFLNISCRSADSDEGGVPESPLRRVYTTCEVIGSILEFSPRLVAVLPCTVSAMTKYKVVSAQTPSGGRPLLGKSRRVQISISIDVETKKRLREAAAQRGLSTGLLIDELVLQLA